jgi:transcriptional regulator with XRE-family HTH domain
MALFFDSAWFDARMAALGLSRAALSAALGIDEAALADIWKDQRELSAGDVRLMAALLDTAPKEIASRAGISTPIPRDDASIEQRLARLEAEIAAIRALLKRQPP